MKLRDDFLICEMAGETVLVAVADATKDFNGIIRCNATSAFLAECLRTPTTEEELLQKLIRKYRGDPEQIAESLKKTLDTLRSVHALEE